jgi:hypothetical protein
LTQKNAYIESLSIPTNLIQFFDPRVMVLNNIMFTFHREGIYVVENKTRESWYWSPKTFEKIQPTLKYDYKDNFLLMVQD